MEPVRLQKYIASCGVASRRAAEKLIEEGRVSVNGQIVTEQGVKVTLKDKVMLDGKPIKPEGKKVYIMLNKPEGYICAVSDDRERHCVVDLIEGIEERIFPVGRLDYDTTGLLLLTNDGEFMQSLTHPSYEIWKTYRAVVKGSPNEKNVDEFARGIELEDGKTEPAVLEVVGYKGKNAIVEVSIKEGRNRQVRRMLEAINHRVIKLKRVKIGGLELGDLKTGAWRYMKERDFKDLMGSQN